MKKIPLILLTITVSLITLGSDVAVKTKRKQFNKKAAYEARVAANGGLVTRPYTGKYITIINDQNRISESDFFDPKETIQRIFQFPLKIVKPGSDLSDTAVTITISDNPSAPALLIAPEMPWAGINIRALAVDNPKTDVLRNRLRKEIWRGFMYACGAANSVNQPCVMRPIFGIKDLDSHNISVPCPDSLNRVATCARALGIGRISRCVYHQACQEGWAPAPTNDIQKAIWDKVRSEKERGPTNPIEIPMPKKK
jgi:hypothetical protein